MGKWKWAQFLAVFVYCGYFLSKYIELVFTNKLFTQSLLGHPKNHLMSAFIQAMWFQRTLMMAFHEGIGLWEWWIHKAYKSLLCILKITTHIWQHMKVLPFSLKTRFCNGNWGRLIKFSSRCVKASLIKGRLLTITEDLIPKSRLITFPYFFTSWNIFQ